MGGWILHAPSNRPCRPGEVSRRPHRLLGMYRRRGASQNPEGRSLLLDDVLGKLDENRQNNLLDYIRNYQQVILSTSTLADVKKENLENANIIELE